MHKLYCIQTKSINFDSIESYLSISPDMTIEFMPNPSGTPHLYGPSSAFKLRYEFLDTMLGGAPLEPFSKSTGPKAMPEPAALLQTQSKSCNRVYRYYIDRLIKFKYLMRIRAI